MRARLCVLSLLVLVILFPAGLSAQTLFGYSGNDNDLYTIDLGTPAANLVGNGATGIPAEIEYVDGVIYASSTGTNTELFTIDPATGMETGVINMVFPPDGNVITAMEWVDGTMYAILTTEGGGQAFLSTIDLGSGNVAVVGDTGFASPIGGLAYDGATMYAASAGGSGGELFEVNLGTGAATSIGAIEYVGGPLGTTALEFGPDGVLYALPNIQSAEAGILFSLDPGTGFATEVGDLGVTSMNALTTDGVAIANVVEVPTLSFWGLLALVGLLLWVAVSKLRVRTV